MKNWENKTEKIGENRFFTDLFSLHIYLTQSILRGKSSFQIFPLSLFPHSIPPFVLCSSLLSLLGPHIFISNTPFSMKTLSCCKHLSGELRATFSSKPPPQLQWFGDFWCPSFRVGHPQFFFHFPSSPFLSHQFLVLFPLLSSPGPQRELELPSGLFLFGFCVDSWILRVWSVGRLLVNERK